MIFDPKSINLLSESNLSIQLYVVVFLEKKRLFYLARNKLKYPIISKWCCWSFTIRKCFAPLSFITSTLFTNAMSKIEKIHRVVCFCHSISSQCEGTSLSILFYLNMKWNIEWKSSKNNQRNGKIMVQLAANATKYEKDKWNNGKWRRCRRRRKH